MDSLNSLPVPSVYKSLDSERCALIQRKAKEIQKRVRRAKQDILDIGRLLIEVRSVLEHGQFESWLGQEIAWSPRTAYNFIYVYERFGDITNFAKMEMDISAAYLLAAPKTPQVIVDEFLNRAQSGERITFKTVRRELMDEKLRLSGKNQMREISQKSSSMAYATVQSVTDGAEVKSLEHTVSPVMSGAVQPGWCLLDHTHLLFCGDTASSQFNEHVPYAALAVAFTSNDWAHDWLITSATSVIILPESKFVKDLFEQMLLTFSAPGQAVIFPWLPNKDMLDVAHKLQRRIYAGDPNPERCHQAISAAGLVISPVNI